MTIINRTQTNQEVVLDNLETSSFQFHLCGSRRYGFPRPDSDWDFFTNSQSIHYLESIGFTKVDEWNTGYQDKNLTAIYRHPAGVDVQIREDIELYERCCQFLVTHPEFVSHFGNHYPLRSVF